LNLSSDYEFSFDQKKKSIDLYEKSTLPKDFFGSNISGVSALLGVNGSGKTTALEMICRCITEHYHFKESYILVYEIDRKFYLSTNVKEPFKVNFQFTPDNENLELRKLNTIYFSNVFDQNYIDFNDKVIDVSLNRKMNPRYMYRDESSNIKGSIERQIDFINSAEFKNINLDIPRRVEYKIFNSATEIFKRKKINHQVDERDVEDYLRGIFIKERSEIRPKRGIDKTATSIAQQFLASIVNVNNDIVEVIRKNIGKENNTNSLLKVISKEADVLIGEHLLSEIIDIIVLQIKGWLEAFDYDSELTVRGSKHSFTLNVEDGNLWHHQKLSHIFEMVIEGSASWHGISSGQKAYLNMFCSIWDCIEKNTDNGHSLICIDEGDLYLHPQWQIEFIDKLLKCLPAISNGKVQLIFTTHSPLLISDIPKQCINITDNLTNQEFLGTELITSRVIQTFGANLYDIYSSSFGLKNQRSGTLSSKYIDNILEILDKDILTNIDINDLNSALDIIGDELIIHHIKTKLGEL
jgi:predicted ATPase